MRGSASFETVEVDWLEHASLRFTDSDGLVVYVDPWSEALEGGEEKADLIISTHDDMDHFDVKAIQALKKGDTVLVCHRDSEQKVPEEMEYKVLGPGRMVKAKGLEIRGVEAYNVDKRAESGELFHPKGTVMGIIFSMDGVKFYFSSDTDPIDEMKPLSAEGIDVAFFPAGGHYTMDQEEVVEAVKMVKPGKVVPIHYGYIDATTADPGKFVEDINRETDSEPVVLEDY